ncbi:MAG: tetraacyldisaccharide 4'-kinase [Elusimicrobiota bacterium]|nr:tetraacyldisaccharide 4'-kinase [Elusimicrobiota bacterium]
MDLLNIREKMLKNVLGRLILRLASFLYQSAVKINLFAYRQKWLKTLAVNTRVVCIGNIAAGGTGKTTAVMLGARELAKRGVRVSVVSRGYKRSAKKSGVAVLFDKELDNWLETGDEPYMMSQLLAEDKIPVLVSANRYSAANEALKQFKSQIILLDDGFQHHKLNRDANIVLLNAANPFSSGALLPYGMLREPLCALKRANLIVITHSNLVSARDIEDIKDKIRLVNDEIEILTAIHKLDYFFDLTSREKIGLDKINGAAAVFSAIGDPQSFENTLKRLGLDLKQVWRFSDHASYSIENIRDFVSMRGDLPLITTFKDAVKLPEGWRDIIKNGLYILAVNMEIQNGELDKFLDVLYPNLSKKKSVI